MLCVIERWKVRLLCKRIWIVYICNEFRKFNLIMIDEIDLMIVKIIDKIFNKRMVLILNLYNKFYYWRID